MEKEEQKQRLESPLLQNEVEQRRCINREEILAEVKKQLVLAGPIVSVNILLYCLQVISVMFVGHLGELPLAGASMATSFAAVTGFSLLTGMASALDTFCGQSYGAKQYHMLGIYKQRAMLVVLLTSIPLAFIWFNAASILVFLGQDPEISAEAGSYIRFMVASILPYGFLQCHVKFLQAQNNVVPMMLTSGFTALLHIFTCWVLVFKSGLGNKGAALANAVSYWINVSLLAVYVRVSPSCKMTWTGFSREGLKDLTVYLGLAIPATIMTCLELWSFEMMVLLSGLLRNPKVETSVLSIRLSYLPLTFFFLFFVSISIRVSNELGAGQPRSARLAVCVALCLVLTEGVLMAALLIMGRKFWGYFYSREEKIVRYVAQMLILLAASNMFDGVQSVLSGNARGCGWQKIGACVNLGAYYLVGIPFGILLAFVYRIGGKGLWLGITVALFAQGLLLGIITLFTNWEKEVSPSIDKLLSCHSNRGKRKKKEANSQ
ncbi:hypothetical protein NMG60_11005753 [Bertholletia excelsa]